ncbi:acyltransferase family protein [Escherichia coli]|nr:acyltransferase [Escherichia coli]
MNINYRPEIDGLRSIAVLSVIFFHAGITQFSGGFVGVDVFFVISGYLITTTLINEQEKCSISISNFYRRRAKRIIPALFLVIAVTTPAAYLYLAPKELSSYISSILYTATFSSNFLFWQESGYWDTATALKPLIHTWSLAVEEQFYLIFPFIVMMFWRFGAILFSFFSCYSYGW